MSILYGLLPMRKCITLIYTLDGAAQIHTYTVDDGFTDHMFNRFLLQRWDEEAFFGGFRGLNSFI